MAGLLGLGIAASTVGLVLIVAGVLAIFNARVRAMLSPLFVLGAKWTPVLMIVLGLVLGGLPVITGAFSGVMGGASVASIAGVTQAEMPVADLSKCVYTSGDSESASLVASSVSIRTDPNSVNTVYIDIDESAYNATAQAENEANLTFTCTRQSDIGEDESVHIVVEGAKFKNEISTTDNANIYNIITTTAVPSSVFPGEYQQTVYVADNAVATTSSTKEEAHLTFAEGEKTQNLGVKIEIDATSYSKMENYSLKEIKIDKEIDGVRTTVGKAIVQKLP
jgi:hypothetical protein